MVIREQGGLQTPYNTLLISRDTGKTYFEFTWNDASNIDVLLFTKTWFSLSILIQKVKNIMF